uniref:Uncharacterized protein n=1 Tax=Panagrellus redivivus TaxID=6233 RepID=A0A7E4V058_PANRE
MPSPKFSKKKFENCTIRNLKSQLADQIYKLSEGEFLHKKYVKMVPGKIHTRCCQKPGNNHPSHCPGFHFVTVCPAEMFIEESIDGAPGRKYYSERRF